VIRHNNAYQIARRSVSDPEGRELALFEDITNAAESMNQPAFEGIVHLRPQTAHVDINDIRAAVKVHVPHVFGDHGSREHFARSSSEEAQETKLLRSEVDPRTAAGHAVPKNIDLQVCDSKNLGLAARTATQERSDARHQLGKSEGLYEIVIGAEIETLYPIANIVAGRDKEDRRLISGSAQFSYDRPPISSRQQHIQDHQIVRPDSGQAQCLLAIVDDVDDEAVLRQSFAKVLRSFALILDDQKLHVLFIVFCRGLRYCYVP